MVSVFFIFQQITGINVPLYYGPHLLGPIFSGAHASLVQTTVAGVEVTAIMTAVNVASTYLGFRWIDKFGRRALSIGGYTGMIVFALVAALGLAFTSGTLRLVVIMIGLDFFIASFAIGVGGTGWTLQGEVFPTAVRGQAAAFCAMIDWLANFLLDRGVPGLAERDQPGRRPGLLRRPGRAGHRVHLEVPARDQGPAGRGDRQALRAEPVVTRDRPRRYCGGPAVSLMLLVEC